MKKTLISLSLLFCYAFSRAQITFDQGDVIQPGFWFVQEHDTLPVVQPGNSGANVIWDFSALNSHGTDTITAVNIEDTPYATDFMTSDLAIENPNGGNPITYFLSNETNGLFMDGLAGDPSGMGLPMVINFNPQEEILAFPATFNTSFSNQSVFDEKIATTAFPGADSVRIKSINNRTANIDAWGTVTTPSGTYDALRQYEVNNRVDSAWVHVAIIGWIPVFDTMATTYLYQWIAENVGHALVEMNTDSDGYSTSVNWISFTTYNSLAETRNTGNVSVFPNPASGTTSIVLKDQNIKSVMLYDEAGTLLQTLNVFGPSVSIDVTSYPAGCYLLHTVDAGGSISGTATLVVER